MCYEKISICLCYAEPCVCRSTLIYKNNPLSKTIDVVKSPKKVVADAHYNPALNFYLDKPVNKFAANQLDSLDFKLLAREQDIFEGRETLIFLKWSLKAT